MAEVEEQAAGAAKKKSKLPLVLIVALVLAGGGFFAMKSRGQTTKKPKVKLGKIAEIKDEFLVPLMGEGNYLRANISFHLASTADEHEVEESMAAIRDAINMRLKSKWLKELKSIDDIKKLKRELAADVNLVLGDHESDHEEPDKDAKETAKDGADKASGDTPPKHPEWDSDTGPVLKVYFTTFATQ
jgi:flagellar FliL protein